MTKYVLKKDTPFYKKGAEFCEDWFHKGVLLDDYCSIVANLNELDNPDEWFEEVKSGWWKPKHGQRYYYTGEYGRIKVGTWNDCLWDKNLYAMGDVFKTYGATERYCDYLKAVATVRQDEGVLTPTQVNELIKNEDLAYYVGYMGNRGNGEVLCGCTMSFEDCWMPVGVILFDSEAHADRSLRNHQDEWKIIANYDWSRE